MSYGLQVLSPSGNVIFDATRIGGVFVEFVTISQGTSGSRTYPAFAGRTLFASNHYSGLTNLNTAWNVWSISHPSGMPTLTWSYPAASGGLDIYLILFVR